MTSSERPTGARDNAFMRRALVLARKGWGRTAPNPMVGAVVVRDGEIVGEGWHAEYGAEHAEPAALRAAGDLARGATLYVSLEPCAHQGKTPPCVDAVVAAGVRRVVVATRDSNPLATGGIARLVAAGIATTVGVEEDAARELNAPFFHALNTDRPFVRLKLALSLDGAVADAARARGWLTGPGARRHVHRMRADSDAVAVGIGTVLTDDPALTVRGVAPPRVPPTRVVFDRRARLPITSQLVRAARSTPVILVTATPAPASVRALEAAGVTVLPATSLHDALRQLRRLGTRSLFVEGGAAIAGALLDDSLVDRLIIFRAPIVLGAGALSAFASAAPAALATARRWRVVEQRLLDDDTLTIYAPPPG